MSALTSAGSTRRWRRIRRVILARDGHRCQVPVGQHGHVRLVDGGPRYAVPPVVCGAYATTVDHIIARVLGGTDDPDNLRAACLTHNLRKGARALVPVRLPQPPTWRW